MKRTLCLLIVLATITCGLPVLGMTIFGFTLERYLEFPPHTLYVEHPEFDWRIFIGLSAVLLVFLTLFFRTLKIEMVATSQKGVFPWWGWLGIFFIALGWCLGWMKFEQWQLQIYYFFLLWLGYILLVQALTYQRAGFSLLSTHPKIFLLLFPISACFWWVFEFLNRFVQNWYYLPVQHLSATEYFLTATLSFSTVLNAVFSTRCLLGVLKFRLSVGGSVLLQRPPELLLCVFGLGPLFLLGIIPNELFPFVWVSPLCLSYLLFKSELETRNFNLQQTILWGLSAVVCGFFWEFWNFGSLFKWKYLIPYVDTLRIYEMPLLGYAGYIPFGILCGIICEALAAKK